MIVPFLVTEDRMQKKKHKGKYAKRPAPLSRRSILMIVLAVSCVLLLIAIGTLLFLTNRDELDQPPTEPSVSDDISESTESIESSSEATQPSESAPEETAESTEETTQPLETAETTESTESTQAATAPTQPTTPVVTAPPVTEPEKVVLTLPYVIPGTSIVIQRVAPYDGIFLEDGSDAMVSNVAMVMLYNAGTEAVEYAKISMKYDDKTLEFEISAIPAGATVVAQEMNKQSCASGYLRECTADAATRAELEMAKGVLSIVDNGDNSLTITNLTDQEFVTVRIFYKYYLSDENAYAGGITYTAKISNLKAKESITITPSHYASSGSTVVMVRTYDTDV